MTSRNISLRVHRRFRKGQQQVEHLSTQASGHIDRHIVGRLGRLIQVRRFLTTWLGIALLLIGTSVAQLHALSSYYQTLTPVPGGTYTEGILGDFTNANPLYATGSVDTAAARLLFASLLKYNENNQLVGDLAQSWTVDPFYKIYTVHLKPGLTWQDGQPLTANDVVFTYHTIQNPIAHSPLNQSWQNVTVVAPDPLTIVFTLNNALSAFPYSLTNGIVPEHLLSTVAVDVLRSAPFNTNPIGAGPFAWKGLQAQGITPESRQEQISLLPFTHYNGGQPKLEGFVIRAFHDQQQLISNFKANALDGIAGLNNVPASLANKPTTQIYSLPLTAANMVFFKTTNGVLADSAVRQALVKAADVDAIISGLKYPVIPVREPLLNNQLGFNAAYAQFGTNVAAAAQQLQNDGWVLGVDNIRHKAGQPLTFKLTATVDTDSQYVAHALQQQWRAVGVDVPVVPQDTLTLQDTLTFHTYDALLYGISIGVDPDVFVYWDSSQADLRSGSHLNFSEYKSAAADKALEAGRTRADASLRSLKYQPFLQTWQQDAPALGLYQPRFLYITHRPVYGLTEHSINQDADRYANVESWEIRQANVTD